MNPYLRLMRLDRPVGTLLLLWPTLWALWLAAGRIPDLYYLCVFVCGVFVMRSVGCVINDYADRHIDGKVRRTCQRPFPQGKVSIDGCKILLGMLLSMAFLLVLTLNRLTIVLSSFALLLAWFYPFAKRVVALPQLFLGLAFGWSIPMVFAAVSNHLPLTCWVLLLATLCWVMAYDTQYALADREDDLNIGVKSAAILFGRFTIPMIGLLQLITLFLMVWIGRLNQLGAPFYCAISIAALLFLKQLLWLSKKQNYYYLRAFSNNNWVGFTLFLGLWLDKL